MSSLTVTVRLLYMTIPYSADQLTVIHTCKHLSLNSHMQWAFGVTCWEVFMGGKIPYPVVDPMTLLKMLEGGQRLEKPPNAACSAEV